MSQIRRKIINKAMDLSKDLASYTNKKGELTLIQIRTLLFIRKKGSVRASDLSREFNVTPATITAQIDRLVEDGWLERINSTEDRRAINIKITKRTEKQLDSIVEENIKKYSWVFEPLTHEDEKMLYDILTKIVEHRIIANSTIE
jgi:DNA-binding MarR family transcriptional regulator